ncbi:MAG: ABC transporter ATP-binding protein [Clostridioides sp.]|jgi:iron complex transport system ATP-binding protein|nr:ABC transporter ATP-binding protein [Clostridioides sp.]
MLEIKNLSSGYGGVDIIRDMNFKVDRGETLCIVGPNGCGKSTLLKSIANLLDYRGVVNIDGEDVKKLSRKELAKKIGLMGQMSEVYLPYTVYETVSLGRYAHTTGFLKNLTKEDSDIIEEAIKRVGLYDVKDKLIDELSGGQLQRTFLARVLAQDPDIILLDEPTNHLDLKHQLDLLGYLTKWARDKEKTVIGVLHDLNLVQYYGDNAILMDDGEIVAYGVPNEVLDGQTLKEIYNIDIRRFMLDSLENWKMTRESRVAK